MMKKTALGLFLLLLAGGMYYAWYVGLNYRFGAITEGRVYKSGKIPPDKIADYIHKYNIRTVIDLRHPGVKTELNPGVLDGIVAERNAVEKIPGVRYVNIPSRQVPRRQNLVDFFAVMDDEASYPVLIHCYHGTGRAMIYSAIYRIEYEGMSNEEARRKTRFVIRRSSFDVGRGKGDFLIGYRPRQELDSSTLLTMRD